MRLALLGDIHGNAAALEAVLQQAALHKVNALVVTGDLVGYYFEPKKVLDLLRPWRRYLVRGNHEEMLARARNDRDLLASIDRKYGSGLRLAYDQLSADEVDELCSLPHPLELELASVRMVVCHGAPWDLDEYIYPDASPEVLRKVASRGCDLVVLGHTHYQMLKKVGDVTVINPGSVGQSRDVRGSASWALYDTDTRVLDFRREPYDRDALLAEACRRHPELAYLAQALLPR